MRLNMGCDYSKSPNQIVLRDKRVEAEGEKEKLSKGMLSLSEG
jgi:hypothetical protein